MRSRAGRISGILFLGGSALLLASLTCDGTGSGKGKVLYRTVYSPCGNAVAEESFSPQSAAYTFTGQEMDAALGMQDYGARFYHSGLCRFTGVDPVDRALSPYLYAENNPLRFVDPSGTRSESWDGDCCDELGNLQERALQFTAAKPDETLRSAKRAAEQMTTVVVVLEAPPQPQLRELSTWEWQRVKFLSFLDSSFLGQLQKAVHEDEGTQNILFGFSMIVPSGGPSRISLAELRGLGIQPKFVKQLSNGVYRVEIEGHIFRASQNGFIFAAPGTQGHALIAQWIRAGLPRAEQKTSGWKPGDPYGRTTVQRIYMDGGKRIIVLYPGPRDVVLYDVYPRLRGNVKVDSPNSKLPELFWRPGSVTGGKVPKHEGAK